MAQLLTLLLLPFLPDNKLFELIQSGKSLAPLIEELSGAIGVFGKAGREVLDGLMAGKSLDEVVNQSSSRLLKEKKSELEKVVRTGLDEEDIFQLKSCLRIMERLDDELRGVDARIAMLIGGREEDVKRVGKVPGVGQTSASGILAEIGDPRRFADGKKIASWSGLCPSVYQTAEKNLTGRLKQGSRYLRRLMVQVAHSACRVRDSRLRLFYLRVAARRGRKRAVVALARKILCIIHHLLVRPGRAQRCLRVGLRCRLHTWL